MKITGYRTLKTIHRWGRPIGDVNGVIASGITEVPILLLTTDAGLTGIGVGAHGDIDRVFPAIDGEDPRAVTALYDRMLALVFKSGHAGSVFGAIGAIDMALWDLKAKLADEPLWRTLGARDPFVPGYASGLDYGLSLDELVALHQRFADRGFTGFKLKGGLDVEQDILRLEAVRQVYLNNSTAPAVMIDVNESLNRKQAVRYADRIGQRVDLTWIEEPVRRWDAAGLASVGRGVKCAVASGENLTGLDQFTPLFDADAVDIVQTGMCWGITHFLRVAIAAHAHNLPISPVGYNGNPVAHGAASVPNHLSTEVQDLGFPVGLKVDQEIVDGGILLGSSPGIGFAIQEEVIAAERDAGNWSEPAGPHVRPVRAGLRLGAEH